MKRIFTFGCAAVAALALCAGAAHAAVTIAHPGYYSSESAACTLTPELSWTDDAPGATVRYKVELAQFAFGTWTPSWTTYVRSRAGDTSYDTVYSGPALSWDTWYAFTVSRQVMYAPALGGPKVTDYDFDYFMTVPVTITNIDYSGAEYVRIENDGTTLDVEMTGWTLRDTAGHDYVFPTGFTLGVGDYVKVHTGVGTDTATDLYWGYESYVWNDDGDTATLRDNHGNTVDQYSY